jgi:hypothetical protein
MAQAVVVDLLHQLQQAPYLAFGETFSRKPVEVIAGQVGQQHTFVFSKGHWHCDQLQQVFGVHDLSMIGV